MKYGVVPQFRGEYYFLSNYYVSPMIWRGLAFDSGEQAFAYAKSFFCTTKEETNLTQLRVLEAKSPGEAKQAGRRAKINVDEWDKHRVQYMREIVHAKFGTGENLVGPLLNTGSMMLVEGNDWGDTFWGRCLDKNTGKMVGLNTLGVLLMEERGYWLYSNFKETK